MSQSNRGGKVCNDATEMIGETPLVHLNKVIEGLNAKIACKVEYFNPACSVKDRIGFAMIDAAEKAGLIEPHKTIIIEPTSGNTGIALAWVGASRGYKVILVMPSSMSMERKAVAKALGAEVVLTDPKDGFEGVVGRADDLHKAIPNSFVPRQFANPANPLIHYNTTGPEIWAQTQGKVDICVFGTGTGGTISGVGRYLKEKKPDVKMYAVEPTENSVINGIPPCGINKIQGIGPGFFPDTLDLTLVEEALRVSSEEAVHMAKRLAREEGFLVGISSGANVCGAIEVAKRPENAGKLIVTSFPDFGERYLSSCLYNDIREECEKMTHTTFEEDKKHLAPKLNIPL